MRRCLFFAVPLFACATSHHPRDEKPTATVLNAPKVADARTGIGGEETTIDGSLDPAILDAVIKRRHRHGQLPVLLHGSSRLSNS